MVQEAEYVCAIYFCHIKSVEWKLSMARSFRGQHVLMFRRYRRDCMEAILFRILSKLQTTTYLSVPIHPSLSHLVKGLLYFPWPQSLPPLMTIKSFFSTNPGLSRAARVNDSRSPWTYRSNARIPPLKGGLNACRGKQRYIDDNS